jgi:hypothetical protein
MTAEQIAELDEEGLAFFPLDTFLQHYSTQLDEVRQAGPAGLLAATPLARVALIAVLICCWFLLQFVKLRRDEADHRIRSARQDLEDGHAQLRDLRKLKGNLRSLLFTLERSSDTLSPEQREALQARAVALRAKIFS